MTLSEEHVRQLKVSFPDREIKTCDEAGVSYYLIPAVTLTDRAIDLLFCPAHSKLFFSEIVPAKQSLNWNINTVILARTWYAFSWRVDNPNQSPIQLILYCLRPWR